MTRRFTQLEDIKPFLSFYEVMDDGRVWAKPKILQCYNGTKLRRYGKWLAPRDNAKGYKYITLCHPVYGRKSIYIHRLVGMVHLGYKYNHILEINHIDGNKANNHVSNLEWATKAQNIRHAYDTKLINNCGENNHFSKLTEHQTMQIFEMVNIQHIKTKKIAKQFDVSETTIREISLCLRDCVKHRTSEINPIRQRTLTKQEALEMYQLYYFDKKPVNYLQLKFNVHPTTISNVTQCRHRYTRHLTPLKPHTKGEFNGSAKLSNENVQAIYSMFHIYHIQKCKIADIFNVSRGHITILCSGKHFALTTKFKQNITDKIFNYSNLYNIERIITNAIKQEVCQKQKLPARNENCAPQKRDQRGFSKRRCHPASCATQVEEEIRCSSNKRKRCWT